MAAAASGGTIVVPGEYATQDAPTQNHFPFSNANFRYQQLYEATLFSGPLNLSGVAFRNDGPLGTAADTNFDIQIDFSITQTTPGSISTTYADNLGPVTTTVFQGNQHAVVIGTVNPDGTANFEISFPFLVNFQYDPALGNLLMDVRMGTHLTEGAFPTSDTYLGTQTLSPVRVFGPSNQVSGQTDSVGLVTQFTFGSAAPPPPRSGEVPEPGSIWLAGGAMAAWAMGRRLKL